MESTLHNPDQYLPQHQFLENLHWGVTYNIARHQIFVLTMAEARQDLVPGQEYFLVNGETLQPAGGFWISDDTPPMHTVRDASMVKFIPSEFNTYIQVRYGSPQNVEGAVVVARAATYPLPC